MRIYEQMLINLREDRAEPKTIRSSMHLVMFDYQRNRNKASSTTTILAAAWLQSSWKATWYTKASWQVSKGSRPTHWPPYSHNPFLQQVRKTSACRSTHAQDFLLYFCGGVGRARILFPKTTYGIGLVMTQEKNKWKLLLLNENLPSLFHHSENSFYISNEGSCSRELATAASFSQHLKLFAI